MERPEAVGTGQNARAIERDNFICVGVAGLHIGDAVHGVDRPGVQELREEIKNNDKKAYERLAKQRDEIKQKLDEAAKSKQVADYCSSSNAADVSKGRKLNISN